MILRNFEQQLKTVGEYDSDKCHQPVLYRLPGVTPLTFYSRLIHINVAAAMKVGGTSDYFPDIWKHDSYRVFRMVESIGAHVSIRGARHLSSLDAPAVIIGNHMSSLETMLLPSIVLSTVPRFTFVIKDQLMNYPALGRILRAVHVIAVGRLSPKEDLKHVLSEGLEKLQNGYSIVIFPQQTRTPQLDFNRFNSLGIKLAKRAGRPVVPLALKTDLWSNGSWIKDLGKIDVSKDVKFEFGEPLEVDGSGKEAHRQCFDFIESRLTEWAPTS